jgi:nicotinate-nucleotide adenylyltransferase
VSNHRVLLFGGSFNPPHVGHVFLTAWALSTQRFDALWWIPTFDHAFGKRLAPFDVRVRMCERAVSLFDGRATVSCVEREIGGESRTIKTLDHLEAQHPGTEFTLLMGADLLAQIPKWERGKELIARVPILVIGRQNSGVDGLPVTLPDISSHDVRAAVGANDWRDVEGSVPSSVVELIRAEGLYRAP